MPHDAVTPQPDPSLTEEAVGLAFAGLAPEEILALREGTAWKHFPARGAQRFAHLLSLADIDAYLRTDGARSPRVAMADDSRQGSAPSRPMTPFSATATMRDVVMSNMHWITSINAFHHHRSRVLHS